MRQYRIIGSLLFLWSISMFTNSVQAQQMISKGKGLSRQEKSIISIAALTAKGDLENLKLALKEGLEAGLTVN